MDRPSEELLARMPLAEAVMLLWQWVMDPERLQAIWNEHRGRCYEKQISFEIMVGLISDALIKRRGSGRKAFEVGIESNELAASLQAAYQKNRSITHRSKPSFLERVLFSSE